jgi:uncharacterized membrane protein YphA (DoxX/SURF4 family)
MAKSTTNPVIAIGRSLYAVAILAFGLQYAIFGHLRPGLPLCPNWLPDGTVIAYVLAAVLIAAGVVLLATWRVAVVSLMLGLLLLASCCLYLQHMNFVLHNGNGRTVFLECLAIASAALVLHGLSTGRGAKLSMMPGRIFFAFTLIVFGAQHFMYERYVATLVPAWIPQHTFWIVATGIALIAAGLSLATTIADKIASFCLFAMFFGWLVLLHVPRILHALHSGDEWSSGFVALAFCGASLLLAASSDQTSR